MWLYMTVEVKLYIGKKCFFHVGQGFLFLELISIKIRGVRSCGAEGAYAPPVSK